MKKYLFFAAAAIFAIACQPKEQPTPSITLSTPAEVTVPVEGDIVTVGFTTNVDWTASLDNKAWSITPASGSQGTVALKVTAPQNDSNDPVTATLTIRGDKASATVKFTQLQKDGLIVPTDPIEVDETEQVINIPIKTNVDVKVSTNVDWLTFVETKGLVDKTVSIKVAANDEEEREGIVMISGAKQSFEITVKQAALKPYFEIEGVDEYGYLYAAKEASVVSFKVKTNVEYEVTTYETAFPWQHVSESEGTYTVNLDANEKYGDRTSYIKFTSSQYQVPVLDEDGNPTGETQDMVVRVYILQEGNKYVQYSLSMYDMEFDTWGTTVLSEAVYNGKHYVSNGQDLYEITPENGAFKKIDWFCGNGMTQKVITNDDAGNLIVCNHTAYSDSYLDGYFILNAVTPSGTETNLITKAAFECGGPFGAEIKVRGDVTKDAIIVAPVEGIAGVTMAMNADYWEIKDGVVGDYNSVTVTGFVGTWGCGAWNTYPNNFPTITALGTTAAEGFAMSGCYEENTAYIFSAEGTTMPVLYPDPDQSGNYAYQTIDMIQIGSNLYLVSIADTFFPEWGLTPVVSLVDVNNLTTTGIVHEVAIFDINAATYFSPDWDYGISPACSAKLYNADGKIGIAFASLNGRCVENYVLDPAILAK
ncbi:MAG: hypothetical protein MJY42_00475 [Bacteroidales bacterium]|nr:hypothetical protein [Bacteroidales bacterium]